MDGGAHHRTSPAHRHPWHKPTGDPVGSPEGRSSSRVLGAPRKGVGGRGLKAFHGILSPRIPPPSPDQTPRAPGKAGDAQWPVPSANQLSSFGCPGPPLSAPPGPSRGPRNAGDRTRRWKMDAWIVRCPPAPPSEWPPGPAARRKGGALVRWGHPLLGGVLPKREGPRRGPFPPGAGGETRSQGLGRCPAAWS